MIFAAPWSCLKVRGADSDANSLTQVDPRHLKWGHNDGSTSTEPVARVYAYDGYENLGLGIVASVFRGVVKAAKLQLSPGQEATGILASGFEFDLAAGQLVCRVNEAGWSLLEDPTAQGSLYGVARGGFRVTRHATVDPPELNCKLSSPGSAEVLSGPVGVNLDTLTRTLGDLVVIERLPLDELVATFSPPGSELA